MDSDKEKEKPFSRDFVIRTTLNHMKRSVDISIRKTFDRLPEFNDNPRVGEVFSTLSELHTMRKILDDFQNSQSKDK